VEQKMKDYKMSVNSSLHGLVEVFCNLRHGLPKDGEITGFCVEKNCLVRFDTTEILVYEVL
jgi:hypothetical protein